MGFMSNETRPLTQTPWEEIDKRVRRVDEDRWISSRFAPAAERRALVALYALAYELVRVREAVSEETLGLIRFQWWREAIQEIEAGKPPRGHDVCLALAEEIGKMLNPYLLHHPLTAEEEQPTFAFPFSPAEIEREPRQRRPDGC